MKSIKYSLVLLCLGASGCSMFPYDSHFLCEKNADYGRCMSMQGAYNDSLSGETATTVSDNAKSEGEGSVHKPTKEEIKSMADAKLEDQKARDEYRNSQYRAMADLMNAPVAPVLAPPKVLRTMVVAYQDGQTLFMPRYLYMIVNKPHFVMGDYLTRPIDTDAPSIFPNGPVPDALDQRR